jgi:NADH dehydrogenase
MAEGDTVETTKPGAHVVIVGGGFAGLGCARKLAKSGDVQVTLIDKNNYHQFQPLLYQVATAELASSNVATSLRQSLRGHANVNVKMAEVMVADPKSRTVTTRDGRSYQGDFLVLAAGSQANFFHTQGAEQYSFTRSRTHNDCARGSWRCSRTRTAMPAWWKRAR